MTSGTFVAAPPVRRPTHFGLLALVALVAGLVLLPLAALAVAALSGTGADWPHLARNVIPASASTTIWLLLMTGSGTAVLGVGAAWLVTAYDFPLRRTLSWAVVLPLSVPPYLAAYAFGEFFLYSGPVQSLYRAITGYQTARDYWFPDIRSIGGAAAVLIFVLYPYVYLTVRIVFLLQGRNIADVARTLGATPGKVFLRILLPVARPAIVAGVALVLMEAMNDIGAVEYLGVQTMTRAVFTTWINRSSLEGAAQIAIVMMILVTLLLTVERWARRRQRFHDQRATQLKARRARMRLVPPAAAAAITVLLLPVAVGFGVPAYVFGRYALRRLDQFADPQLGAALVNSLLTGATTAILSVSLALLLVQGVRISRSAPMALLQRLATLGYALPGTIIGLGLLFSLAHFDNAVDAFARARLGVSTGLFLTGTAAAVVIACVIRFLALAEGALRSGLEKLPPNIDDAARSLGCSPAASALTVLLPLLRPAIGTAAVLVFVDTVKELSATILLRPFGFNTLATLAYENASRGAVQDGALAGLLIIATSTLPIIALSGALARDSEASL